MYKLETMKKLAWQRNKNWPVTRLLLNNQSTNN